MRTNRGELLHQQLTSHQINRTVSSCFQDLPPMWDAYFCRLLMFLAPKFPRYETPIVHATLILGIIRLKPSKGHGLTLAMYCVFRGTDLNWWDHGMMGWVKWLMMYYKFKPCVWVKFPYKQHMGISVWLHRMMGHHLDLCWCSVFKLGLGGCCFFHESSRCVTVLGTDIGGTIHF